MPFAPGTKLGPYEIVAPLGTGGMGEVYQARDIRLDRTVAVKLIPARLSQDPELPKRLDTEARAISKEVPVGFEQIRIGFEIEAPLATPEQLRALQEKTEQYCVVMHTLVQPPKIQSEWVAS